MTIALIFDMDGLLIDSEPLYKRVEKGILKSFGITDFSILNEAFGMKSEEAFAMYVERLNLPADPLELRERCRVGMLEMYRTELQLLPHAADCLATFHRAGHPLALASSSMRPLLEAAVGKFGIDRFFSAIISGDEVTNGKPNPEIFLKAAGMLGAEPSDCVVFEDAPHGVLAAKRAGMKCIAIPNPFTPREKLQDADRILAHLGEVDASLLDSLISETSVSSRA